MTIFLEKVLDDSVYKTKGNDVAVALLLSQYQNSPNLLAYLKAYTDEMNLLYENIDRVYLGRFLEYAEGKQLDTLGEIVGVSSELSLDANHFGFLGSLGSGTFDSTNRIYKDFFTADGTSTSGSFDEVTLKGDFKIKFKAVNSGAAGVHMVLGNSADSITHIHFNAGALKINANVSASHTFGTPTLNKLLNIVIERSSGSITCLVDGVQLGAATFAPNAVTFDQAFRNSAGNYFDNVISDLEIIDLDQPATRDVLTFGGVNEYGSIPTWTATGDFEINIDVSSTVTSLTQTSILGDTVSAGAQNYVQLETGAGKVRLSTTAGNVEWTHNNEHRDGRLHVLTFYRSGLDIGIKLDGAVKALSARLSAPPVTMDVVGALGSTGSILQYFNGKILDVKLHDLTTPSNSRRYRMDVESNGYVLDDYQELGTELVTNGTFDTDTSGWTVGNGAVLTNDGGRLKVENGLASFGYAQQIVSTEVGKTYTIDVSKEEDTSTSTPNIRIGTTPSQNQLLHLNQGVDGTYSGIFTATTTTTYISQLVGSNILGQYIIVDNISVREAITPLTLNNVISSDWETMTRDTDTGELRNEFYPNLLKWSEQFDNGVWSLAQNATLTPNADIAPDGTNTATRVVFTDSLTGILGQTVALSNTDTVTSCYIKGTAGETIKLDTRALNSSVVDQVQFVLSGDWERLDTSTFSVDWAAQTDSNIRCSVRADVSNTARDILVWGAQLEESSAATTYVKTEAIAGNAITDSTYVQPANILWRMDQGRSGVGAYETDARSSLGTELVTNGTFDTDTSGWYSFQTASASVVSGAMRVTNDAALAGRMVIPLGVLNGTYLIDMDYLGGTSVSQYVYVTTTATGSISGTLTSGIYWLGSTVFTATSQACYLVVGNAETTAGLHSDFDNISVREAPNAMTLSNVVEADWVSYVKDPRTNPDDWEPESTTPYISIDGSEVFRSITPAFDTVQLNDTYFRRAVRAKALCNGATNQSVELMYEVILACLGRVPSTIKLSEGVGVITLELVDADTDPTSAKLIEAMAEYFTPAGYLFNINLI